ncbi:MAG: PBSX family phage terminase large subunit [Gammaproteobacteria bacterium]|nr:PBSX family phage terminase large subunit [Gammaproteobacteria bacterium]
MGGRLKNQPLKEIKVTLNHKLFNEAYLPYIEDNTRMQIFFGGASAGKSQFVIGQRIVRDILKGKRNYLVIRQVSRTSRTSTFNQICQTITNWNLHNLFKINSSDMVITCLNHYQILFEGLDNVEKLKSIVPRQGVLTDIVIEEATETKLDDIKQLQKRLRGIAGVPKRMVLVFNPIFRNHWIHTEYFEGRFHEGDRVYHDDGLLIFHTTYKVNRFLEPDDIVALEGETSQYHYDVYTLGKWGVQGGVIFTNWKVDDLSLDISRFDNIKNGLDFGFGSDPAAYNRIHYDRMRKRIYIFDEFNERGQTNPMLASTLRPIIGSELIVCDSAEPKSIQELRDNGINAVGAKKGKDSVSYGIQFLQQHEIIIDRKCQETINEFEQYQWKKLRSGEDLNVPVGKNNHHIDEIRYALEDEMPDEKAKVTPRISMIAPKGIEYIAPEFIAQARLNLRAGEELIEIWEGDKIVSYEIMRPGGKRQGIYLPGIR